MAITSLRRLSRSIHKSRWDRAQQGMTPDEIAKEDKVSKVIIERSLRMVELFRLSCSPSELEVRQVETLMVAADRDEAEILSALVATTAVYDSKGKKVGVAPDHSIRMEAVKEVTKRMEILIGKKDGGGGGVNVQINNGTGSLGRSVTTFEDRLREIQSRRALPPEGESVSFKKVEKVIDVTPLTEDSVDDIFSD
jgi:hypothetical protein